jgi:phospholipid/cholesterol/gamma-HCH transport system substrate-binding protein
MLKKFSNEVIVGLFVLVCSALLIWVYLQLKGGNRGEGLVVHADFASVNGLIPDNAVTMAGVRIGRVGGISLHKGRARVRIALFPGITLRKGTIAVVQAKSLLGEKVLVLKPGPVGAPLLKSGAKIEKTLPTVDITDLFSAIPTLIGTVQDIGPDLKPLAKEITSFVRNINKAIEKDPKGSRNLILQLSGALREGRQTLRLLNAILKDNRWNLRSILRTTRRFVNSRQLRDSLRDARLSLKDVRPLLKQLKGLGNRVDKLVGAVSPQDAKRMIRDFRVLASRLRRLSNSMQNTGPRLSGLLRDLSVIFRRLSKLKEWHIRKFAQQEGIQVRVFGMPKNVAKRLKSLAPPSRKKP